MSVVSYSKSGNKSASPIKLPTDIFNVEIKNFQLIKDVYVAHAANNRENIATTLKRGEVRGGGRKPWRQKGTGRARTGSIRNPIWRGGGIVFGPSGDENYSKKINSKAKNESLKQSLTHSLSENKILVIESLEIKDGKTKSAVALLEKIGIKGHALIVADQIDNNTKRSFSNIKGIKLISPRVLSTFDVMNSRQIILTKNSIEMMRQKLLGDKNE